MDKREDANFLNKMFEDEIEKVFEKSINYQVGDKISKTINDIDNDNVFVDLGLKSDGMISKAELVEEDGSFKYKIGDTVEAYIVKIDDNSIILSKSLQNNLEISKEMLFDAFEKKIPVEGKVIRQVKGGFSVNVLGQRTFCPVSHISKNFVSNPAAFVGQRFEFLIQNYEEKGRNIVVSRKTLMEKLEREAAEKLLSQIEVGSVVDGVVSRMSDIGVFVDLGGIEGFVHISELAWSRVNYPLEVLNLGDKVKVKVLKIEKDKKDRYKISLSYKMTQPHPFEKFIAEHDVNDELEGTVKNISSYGAFIEVYPGVEGLLHVSEISYEHISTPRDALSEGETVKVKIIDINKDKRKIGLSIKAMLKESMDAQREEYTVGTQHKGTVKNIEKFGAFVELTPVISGLMPMSVMREAGFDTRSLEEGKEIEVRVLGVKDDGRISLEPIVEGRPASPERQSSAGGNWKSYVNKSSKKGSNVFEKLFEDLGK